MTAAHWNLAGTEAHLGATGATLQLDRPGDGLQGLHGLQGAGDRVLMLTADSDPDGGLQLEDAYVRGVDLVALYKPTDAFPFRTEVYWRIENPDQSIGRLRLTLIVSVETDLLDTHPALTIASRLHGGNAMDGGSDPPQLLADLKGPNQAWFEAVHPTDASEAISEFAGNDEDALVHRWRLFSRFLEKGVIRRARLLAALLPSEDAQAASREAYQAFRNAMPPLTV